MKGIIYKWTCNVNGKSYVGQTTNEKDREKKFLNITESYAGKKIDNARRKYGVSDGTWTKTVLKRLWCKDGKESELLERLNYWERYYIKEYDTFCNGYNSTDGGDNFIFSQEIIDKLKIIGKEYWKNLPEEERENRRKKGKEYWENLPEEEKEEWKKKGKEYWENLSEEEKEEWKKKLKKKLNPPTGHSSIRSKRSSEVHRNRVVSEEIRKILSEAQKRRKDNGVTVHKYTADGSVLLETYDRIYKAAASIKVKGKTLRKYNKSVYKGFYWDIEVKTTKYPEGLSWDKRLNRWRCSLQLNGKKFILGYFKEKDAAIEFRKIGLEKIENGVFVEWYSNRYDDKVKMYKKYGEKILN